MKKPRRFLHAILSGVLAGSICLAVDDLLAWLTLGYQVPIRAVYLLPYVAAGLILAVVITLVRPRSRWFTVTAATTALIYAPSVFERVYQAVEHRSPMILAMAAGTAAVVGYGAWVRMLTRFVRPRPAAWALGLGASTAAVGLAVNRNVVDYPFQAQALALDAVILAAAAATAVALRFFGGRRTSIAAIPIALAAAGVFMALRSGPAPTAATDHVPGRPPNVVLIIVDTLRQDVFRSVIEETEEGKRLADRLGDAAWFENAVAAAPWTAPSVGSIMTGLYPGEHGFGRTASDPSRPLRRLSDAVPTLAEILAERGYRNVSIGTNTILHSASGIDRGFHEYSILQAGTEKLPLLTVLVRLGLERPELYQQAASVRRHLKSRARALTADQRPVFLWLHLMDPHYPLQAHPELTPEPAARELDEEDRLYRDEVRYTADELARTLAWLETTLDWDRTVMILVGDHGEMFPSDGHTTTVKARGGGPMLQGHGHALYDELVHVPLVIRPEGGIPGGRRLTTLVSHVDLLATVSELLGLGGATERVDRVSVAGALTASSAPESPEGREVAFVGGVQRGPIQFALRTRDFKVIHYPGGEQPDEIYDLRVDPREVGSASAGAGFPPENAADLLAAHIEAMKLQSETGAMELDPATRERLEALGYLDRSDHP